MKRRGLSPSRASCPNNRRNHVPHGLSPPECFGQNVPGFRPGTRINMRSTGQRHVAGVNAAQRVSTTGTDGLTLDRRGRLPAKNGMGFRQHGSGITLGARRKVETPLKQRGQPLRNGRLVRPRNGDLNGGTLLESEGHEAEHRPKITGSGFAAHRHLAVIGQGLLDDHRRGPAMNALCILNGGRSSVHGCIVLQLPFPVKPAGGSRLWTSIPGPRPLESRAER